MTDETLRQQIYQAVLRECKEWYGEQNRDQTFFGAAFRTAGSCCLPAGDRSH
jgi:hypothetical protein